MLDIKTWDPERHKRLTGMDVGPTLDVCAPPGGAPPAGVAPLRAGARPDRRCSRTSPADPRFVAGLGNVERVDVLPFHQMGRYKWHRLQLNYTLEQTQPPSADLVERTLAIFRNEGLNAV